jgi:hypothetical protein
MFPVFFVEVVAVGKGVDLVGKMGNHKEFVRTFDSPHGRNISPAKDKERQRCSVFPFL